MTGTLILRLSPHSTPRAELSGTDDVKLTRRETQKKNSPRTETRLLCLPPLPRLVDVIGTGKLGSWCGLSLKQHISWARKLYVHLQLQYLFAFGSPVALKTI